MLDYYAQRAGEYEQIYGKPERQADLNVLRSHLIEQVRGQRVLELACGTAYWTEVMSQSAEFVLATDLSPEVLEVAMAKNLPPTTVAFAQADAWNVPRFAGEFSLAFAGFWWSHVPLQSLDGFLGSLRLSLGGGTRAVFIDNRYVHGSSTAILRRDEHGNTWQRRRLADGSEFEVLKNFPDADQLRSALSTHATDIDDLQLEHYWMLSCALREA